MIKFATMEAKNFKFKYYNGEEENPFTDDGNASLWWDGERLFYETITAPGGDSFIKRLRDNYDDALARGGLSGPLADESVPRETRLLIFYLDLWHGKWYPYDDLDEILKY